MGEISAALHEKAIEEIVKMIADSVNEVRGTSGLGPDDMLILKQQAEAYLRERFENIHKMHERFEKNLEEALVKDHQSSLRIGHRKDMRNILRVTPGVTKDTAKAILNELFGDQD